MAGIRVPVYLRDTAKTIDSKAWVSRCETKEYFGLVDEAAARMNKLASSSTFDHEAMTLVLTGAIYIDESHADQVLKIGIEIKSNDEYMKMCTATAWVLLQAYLKAVDEGNWPHG